MRLTISLDTLTSIFCYGTSYSRLGALSEPGSAISGTLSSSTRARDGGCSLCHSSAALATINTLAPLKTVNPRKKKRPWIETELQILINKCHATHRRYKRSGNAHLLNEFLRLFDEVEECSTQACTSFLHCELTDASDNGKDI